MHKNISFFGDETTPNLNTKYIYVLYIPCMHSLKVILDNIFGVPVFRL
jgi:hypothetical protein